MMTYADYIYLTIPEQVREKMDKMSLNEKQLRDAIGIFESTGEKVIKDDKSDTYIGRLNIGERCYQVEYTFELDEFLNADSLFKVTDLILEKDNCVSISKGSLSA